MRIKLGFSRQEKMTFTFITMVNIDNPFPASVQLFQKRKTHLSFFY